MRKDVRLLGCSTSDKDEMRELISLLAGRLGKSEAEMAGILNGLNRSRGKDYILLFEAVDEDSDEVVDFLSDMDDYGAKYEVTESSKYVTADDRFDVDFLEGADEDKEEELKELLLNSYGANEDEIDEYFDYFMLAEVTFEEAMAFKKKVSEYGAKARIQYADGYEEDIDVSEFDTTASTATPTVTPTVVSTSAPSQVVSPTMSQPQAAPAIPKVPTKADMMQEIDALIKEYLTDGLISDRERAVILKKAVSLGLDADEIDLYIDAQQQKADQAVNNAVNKKRGAICPHCKSPIPQMADKCPICGEYIKVQVDEELNEILEKLEDALVDLKDAQHYQRSKAIIDKYARKARMYYSNNAKVQALLAEVEKESAIAEKNAKIQNRNESLKSLAKNKWFWAGSSLGLGAILMLIALATESFEIGLPGGMFLVGGIYGLAFAGGLHK